MRDNSISRKSRRDFWPIVDLTHAYADFPCRYIWIYFHNQHVATPLFQLNQTQLHEQLETLQGLLEGQGLMRPVAYELLHSDSPSISVLERWEDDRRAIRNATAAVQDFMTQVIRAVQNEE